MGEKLNWSLAPLAAVLLFLRLSLADRLLRIAEMRSDTELGALCARRGQVVGRSVAGLLFALIAVWPVGAEQTLAVSLDQVRQQVVAQNPLLEIAKKEVDHARAERLQALSGHLPQIHLSERVLRSNDAVSAFSLKLKQENFTHGDFAIDALNRPEAISDIQTTIELRQPLFNGGLTLHGRGQATAALHATQAQFVRRQQQIELQATEAYWGLVLAREGLEVVRTGLVAAREFAAVARAHHQQQIVPLTDLLAAELRVAELASAEIAADNRIGEANDKLSLLLGLHSTVEVVPLDSLVQDEVEAELSALVVNALQSRPDLGAMGYQVEAARKGVRVERAEYLPHLNAFARIDLNAEELFARQGESWMVGVVMSWNLFSGFATVGAVRQAEARLAQAKAQDRYLHQQIERQVRRAFREVTAAQARIRIGEQTVRHARERRRISQRQYAAGLSTVADLLATEAGLTDAWIRHLEDLHVLGIGLARLEFAVGEFVE